MENERISLPVVALRGMTILPEMVAHFDVSREKSLQAIDQAMTEGEKIFLTGQYEIETEDPDVTDIHRIGCIATIKQIVKLPKKISRVLVSGEQRAELIDLEFKEPYLRGTVAVREDVDTSWEDTGAEQSPLNLEAMVQGLRDIFKEYMAKNPKIAKEFSDQIDQITNLKKMVNVINANVPMSYPEYQEFLEETNLMKRYEQLAYKLVNEIQVLNIKEELQEKIKERVDKNQREYILREELKLIREELGDENQLSVAG